MGNNFLGYVVEFEEIKCDWIFFKKKCHKKRLLPLHVKGADVIARPEPLVGMQQDFTSVEQVAYVLLFRVL